MDFLVLILGLSRTCADPPRAFFFCLPGSPSYRLARVEPPLRPGAFLCSMSASFNFARSAALSFIEFIMAQIPIICKTYVEEIAMTICIVGV